jgi:signal transduction histidine kinase
VLTVRSSRDGGRKGPSAFIVRALREARERACARRGVSADDRHRDAGSHFETLERDILAHLRGTPAPGGPPRIPRAIGEVFRRELIAVIEGDGSARMDARELIAAFAAIERCCGADSDASLATQLADSEALQGMLPIAHDMRSPLSAILLLVEPLRRGQHGPVTAIQEKQLGLIYGAALSLSALASDIIEATRGRTRAESVQRPFSISGTMEDACAVVRPIAEEKGLELTQTHPKVDGRIGDAAALHRVLLNLTSNALKYTDEGSVWVGGTDLDDTRVEFWVKDTGPGIPAEILDTLYERFRAGPAGVRFSATGLGLAICRTLLENMGSSLTVDSGPERGTRFSFVLDLPRAPVAPDAD